MITRSELKSPKKLAIFLYLIKLQLKLRAEGEQAVDEFGTESDLDMFFKGKKLSASQAYSARKLYTIPDLCYYPLFCNKQFTSCPNLTGCLKASFSLRNQLPGNISLVCLDRTLKAHKSAVYYYSGMGWLTWRQ